MRLFLVEVFIALLAVGFFVSMRTPIAPVNVTVTVPLPERKPVAPKAKPRFPSSAKRSQAPKNSDCRLLPYHVGGCPVRGPKLGGLGIFAPQHGQSAPLR